MAALPTVLIVDDVDATRTGLAQLLQLRGYRTLEAPNGDEGLAVLRQHPHVDVVILDLLMPGSGGYGFRQEQLRDPRIADVPVIVFTGADDPESLTRTLKVADVLRKPVSVDALFDAVARWCAQ